MLKHNKCKTFTFIDLFAGIGGFRLALQDFGGICVFSSEWNIDSKDVYVKNYNEIPHGDITKIKEIEIPPHDVLCAGFPCQAFSISGKQRGFSDTRGTLFFDIARIVKYHKPAVLFLENVKNLTRHDSGRTIAVIKDTLDELGYKYFISVLRSSDYGVPQARERVYFIAFRKDLNINSFEFPKPKNSKKVVKDILEKEPLGEEFNIKRPDIKIYKKDYPVNDIKSPYQIGTINKGGQGERIYSIHASGITLSAYGGGAASKTGAYLVKGKIRKLTPRECARLQGFPESFILPVKRSMAYKQFGDSVSIPVLRAIFSNVIKYYPAILRQAGKDIVKNVLYQNTLNI